MGIGYGKVILMGEHEVVHGKPAVAAGLSMGCTAHATPAEHTSLAVEPWGVRVDLATPQVDSDRELLRLALDALTQALAVKEAYAIEARMQIPSGAGLGGSAALSVAIVRALDEARGSSRSNDAVRDASLRWEEVFHGNPSGVDSAMAASGGVALFRKGEPLQPIQIKRRPLLVIGHSGVSASTKETVASVARQLADDPERVHKVFEGIEAVVVNGRRALEDGELDKLGQLMVLNQKLLNSLMLSTARLEEMCAAAQGAGALGAKLTGGGGGGCMIALAPDQATAQAISAALHELGCEAFVVEAGL